MTTEPSPRPPPREVWASRMADASSASVGMKRSMSENTMASSWPGRPMRERGESMASAASVSWVGVVVSSSSAAAMTATTRRSE